MAHDPDVHRRAAESHATAARRHEKAARFWADRDDDELADFERRNAQIEYDAADLERDRDRVTRARDAADAGRPEDEPGAAPVPDD